MPRVKRATHAAKKRRTLLAATKGFRFGRSKKEREARTALFKAGSHALAHRRDKKNDFRRLWNIRIGAAVRPHGLSYSRFINLLKQNKIELDRKVLSDIAKNEPASFERLVKAVQS